MHSHDDGIEVKGGPSKFLDTEAFSTSAHAKKAILPAILFEVQTSHIDTNVVSSLVKLEPYVSKCFPPFQ